MINNYVTSKAIIAKVLADNALDEKDIKITDMKYIIFLDFHLSF